MKGYFRTIDLAKAAGVHPNTVRLYEKWGLIPAPERSPSGYRLYTRLHLDLMRLSRSAMQLRYPGGRSLAWDLVRKACWKDYAGALALARIALAQVRAERAKAEAAAILVEKWAARQRGSTGVDAPTATEGEETSPLSIGQVAGLLDITPDALRNWERNGLISVPRGANGYRFYGSTETERLEIVRALRAAGYGMMSILRMLMRLDAGSTSRIRETLDTPGPNQDVRYATDTWLTSLSEQEKRVQEVVALLQDIGERVDS